MKKQLILLFTLIFTGIFSAAAQDPIYVVNGQVVSDIRNIPPGDIESTEMLPADEQDHRPIRNRSLERRDTHHPAIRHPGPLPGSRRQFQRLYFQTDRLG
ncbi:MAG: hypothetical protein ACLVJK_04190 [Alistipes putredinis]